MKRKKKLYKVIQGSAVTMIAVPLAATPWASVASANSKNYVDRTISISSNYNAAGNPETNLYITEDDVDFTTGDTFRITLPQGVEWNNPIPSNATIINKMDRVLELAPTGSVVNNDNDQADKIQIPLDVKVNGATGELKVKVEPMDSTISGGEYTFAVIQTGQTTAVVDEVKSIGNSEADGGVIRIEEAVAGKVKRGTSSVKLQLPSQFEWKNISLKGSGGFNGASLSNVVINGNTLTATLNIPSGDKTRGFLYLTPRIKAKSDAKPGDVLVSIFGTELSDAEVVVAKYQEWGATIKVEQVNQILSSKFDDKKVVKMTIEETAPNAFIGGREVEVEFPSSVKIVGTMLPNGNIVRHTINYSGSDVNGTVNSDSNKVSFKIPATASSSKRKLVFEAAIAVKTGTFGEIQATVEGAGIGKQSILVSKVVPPVVPKPAAEGKLGIGSQGQGIPDIFLAETMPRAVKQSVDLGSLGRSEGYVLVYFPKGVTFTTTPKVEVMEGDLRIEPGSVQIVKAEGITIKPEDMEEALKFDIKGESTKPSKIRISGITLGLDRNLPEGTVEAKIAGTALSHPFNSKVFNITSGSSFKVANVITPAPNEVKTSGSFVIGGTAYRVGDVEKKMDIAPYIKNNRTYLPVRYVAEVLGIDENNIIWDKNLQMVSLLKGNKVVQITIGKKRIVVNGTSIPIDVVPEFKNDRVMLPITHISQALGSQVRWDAKKQTVYIE
ncbi:copper amine oxidase N-terminal domain-containing protein [Aneurinibacillus migulanus]|uniref:copper amine oxidase N-terminal domain-containing protein n=1 Tax=Aneurinibacillus migulanus TaxID=47500 RepID=UPI00209DFFFC|nr:copper amine oxidase N-terminal domain-containing protein [Aneurinibacillus migulanus]MCP1357747.1 copper amine oxidase N-terminal domain-containing protein [Aneurinibacillus migulanus]